MFSGGGGAGGGVLCIAAHTINLAQAEDLRAKGGAGTTGGGGGGGGVLQLVYVTVNAGITFSAATNVPGGSGPGSGADGSNGNVFAVVLGSASGATTTATVVPQSGKEIITTDDEVTITFVGSFAYANATGANGYRVPTLTVYSSDAGDPVKACVTAKTTTSFTVTFDRVFTGELDWQTEGSV